MTHGVVEAARFRSRRGRSRWHQGGIGPSRMTLEALRRVLEADQRMTDLGACRINPWFIGVRSLGVAGLAGSVANAAAVVAAMALCAMSKARHRGTAARIRGQFGTQPPVLTKISPPSRMPNALGMA
jgi:hypothetical protein